MNKNTHAEKLAGWVSWKRRKPPYAKLVLMYLEGADWMKIDARETYRREDGQVWTYEQAEIHGEGEIPSHWMYLPLPPTKKEKGHTSAFSLVELLCAVAILAIIASLAASTAIRSFKHCWWQISYIATFHNSRLNHAMSEGREYTLDEQLEDGDFQKVLKWR